MNITIDCGGCADKQELHERIAGALNFPDWYGYNLDALMDCLTDLDETTVILTGCSRVAFDAQDFWDTFEDAQRENPHLNAILLI